MVRIPIGRKYISEEIEHFRRKISCSNCGKDFYLYISIREKGEGDSLLWLDNQGAAIRARANARNQINNKKDDIYVKPCPFCGFYQVDMVKKLRIDEFNKAKVDSVYYAFFCAILGIIISIIISIKFINSKPEILFTVYLLNFALWVWLTIKRLKKAKSYNPNSELTKRIIKS